MKYGLQMFSVRDAAEKDLLGALRQVGEMGYRYIEFAGFFGHAAADVRRVLDACGLECSGTHSRIDWAWENFDEAVAYHRAIGADHYIIPGADLSTRAKLDAFIDRVNDLQPRLAAEGIALSFHNHSGEFLPQPEGYVIHEELQKRTRMGFEIDTYWAWNAGVEPVALMEKLRDRIRVVHLKDGLMGGEGRSLGQGQAPVEAVRRYCVEQGIMMVVESETLNPTGPEEVRRCIEFLNDLDAREGR